MQERATFFGINIIVTVRSTTQPGLVAASSRKWAQKLVFTCDVLYIRITD